MNDAERLRRLAMLAVGVGANVQPGQDVHIDALVEHAPIARAVAEEAYAVGARRVVVEYDDRHVRRSAILHAPEEALGSHYRYEMEQVQEMRERQAAVIFLTGDPEPGLFDGLDPERLAIRPQAIAQVSLEAAERGEFAWTIVPAPNEGWATKVFGEPDMERLWQAVSVALRLDETDPVAAWRSHLERLRARRDRLQSLDLDAVRFHGGGTDLTIGLIPGSRWITGSMRSTRGHDFVPNLPTEEVFTSPDLRRADGVARIGAPLVLPRGGVVLGLRLRFEAGRIVEVDATEGAELVRAQLRQHEQAPYLGEVALVDADSAVARAGVTFHDTVFDENAGSHIAWGFAFTMTLPGSDDLSPEDRVARGLNVCPLHTDVVLGAPELDVDGLAADGSATPILRANRWVLDVATEGEPAH